MAILHHEISGVTGKPESPTVLVNAQADALVS